jgi:hypothetical protein
LDNRYEPAGDVLVLIGNPVAAVLLLAYNIQRAATYSVHLQNVELGTTLSRSYRVMRARKTRLPLVRAGVRQRYIIRLAVVTCLLLLQGLSILRLKIQSSNVVISYLKTATKLAGSLVSRLESIKTFYLTVPAPRQLEGSAWQYFTTNLDCYICK